MQINQNDLFLLQGFYFPSQSYPQHFTSDDSYKFGHFAGRIWAATNPELFLTGEMDDYHGHSSLSCILFQEWEVTFYKVYDESRGEFKYTLRKSSKTVALGPHVWVGEWVEENEPKNKGPLHCIITKLPSEFINRGWSL